MTSMTSPSRSDVDEFYYGGTTRYLTGAFQFTACVWPSEDGRWPDYWLGAVLELDLITQGTSVNSVLERLRECVAIVVKEDGLTPLLCGVCSTPAEIWQRAAQIVDYGDRVDLDDIDMSSVSGIVHTIILEFYMERGDAEMWTPHVRCYIDEDDAPTATLKDPP